MPRKKKSVRQIPAAPPEIQPEPYIPGKPQHIAEPHELAPELSQPLPVTPAESHMQSDSALEAAPTPTAPQVQRKARQAVTHVGGGLPYPRPPIMYANSPVYFMPSAYRTMPYPYAPARSVYVPVYPWYGY